MTTNYNHESQFTTPHKFNLVHTSYQIPLGRVMEEYDQEEVVDEIPSVLEIGRDGSINRHPTLTLEPDPEGSGGVASRDVTIDKDAGMWARIFRPISIYTTYIEKVENSVEDEKIPVIVYVHGGGFCWGSPGSPEYHRICASIAKTAYALVISLGYRLAPENRLPAAYHDFRLLLEWIQYHTVPGTERSLHFHGDAWVDLYADFQRLFFVGDGAGSNVIHHVLHAFRPKDNWAPMSVIGAVLIQPFFGTAEKEEGELELLRKVEMWDACWRMCLPLGSEYKRDHSFCNPVASCFDKSVEFPRAVVVTGSRDRLMARGMFYYQCLRYAGKNVELVNFEGQDHFFFRCYCPAFDQLVSLIAGFVSPT